MLCDYMSLRITLKRISTGNGVTTSGDHMTQEELYKISYSKARGLVVVALQTLLYHPESF